MDVNTPVERIKGFRYPAPGSRHEARVPIRESEDHVYSTNYYVRDPANINTNVCWVHSIIWLVLVYFLCWQNQLIINAEKRALLSSDNPKLPSHGKRKITPLLYDSSGLRTTKTATWEALDKSLALRATPDHLPNPAWVEEYQAMEDDRVKKGLPLPMGKRYKFQYSNNYNEVRW